MKKFALLIESAVTFCNPFIVEDRCYAEVAACIIRKTHHDFNDRTDPTKHKMGEDARLKIQVPPLLLVNHLKANSVFNEPGNGGIEIFEVEFNGGPERRDPWQH